MIVTLNYRLGAFGFFAHPELAKEAGHGGSGNYGMMDALAALKWVKRNISAFGGDPNNVTIFGESAGAIMIGAIVGSPQFKGMFQRAIVESGAWMGLQMARMTTTEQAQGAGIKALEAAGKTITELRRMPLADLPALGGGGLVIDGYMIPEDLSIIGYDALPDGERLLPPLATVDQHITVQLRHALDLLARPTPPSTTQSVVVIPTLVQRASCAPPNRR